MQTYSLPARIEGIIFDIDKTLYDDPTYADLQTSLLIERLASEWGKSVEETQRAVDEWRERYEDKNDGQKQSLGNTFVGLGISIETSVCWREELFRPRDHLVRDHELAAAMHLLAQSYRLIAVTNNPRSVGVDTVAALGVDGYIGEVVGLDTTWISKPAPEPFAAAARLLDCTPQGVVSVGDRYDVDIAPALSLGMGGVLVDSVSEVYQLPKLLAGSGSLDER